MKPGEPTEINDLIAYLRQHYAPSTVDRYRRDIEQYVAEVPQAKRADLFGVLDYVAVLRKRYSNIATVVRFLHAIKAYYSYLQQTHQRKDHPCRFLHLKDAKQDRSRSLSGELFTMRELESLLDAQPNHRYHDRKAERTRNVLIISLLIHQGLMREEVVRIRLQDLDLEQARIHIRESRMMPGRTLPLKARQIHLLHQYLAERPKVRTNLLLLNQQKGALGGDSICRILLRYQYLFAGRKLTARTIRMSVAQHLLKEGKDLRLVQVYLGHKYPSTTERYQPEDTESLKQQVEQHHPLQ